MFDKINISEIVKTHFRTIFNGNVFKVKVYDISLFFGSPILIASILVYFCIHLDKDAVAIISGSLSIFVGLFFNIIVLIFDLISRDNRSLFEIEKLRDLIYNISFIILLCLLTILLSFISLCENYYIKVISEFVTYFCCILFLTTVLMVLKRMSIFFVDEISKKLNKSKYKINNESS